MLSRGRLFSAALDMPGPALLFIHGGYHGAWCWQNFMNWFAARGQPCATIDLRGHGGLPQDADYVEQGIIAFSEDVIEAAGVLNRPVVLVGHSLGALVGMAAARVVAPLGQILLAPSPPGQLKDLTPLPSFPENRPVPPPPETVARNKFLSGYKGEIGSLIERLCAESPQALNDRYSLRIHIDPGWVKGKTICLSAGRDLKHLHPPGQDEATTHLFGGRHLMRPESAHDMMLDDHWAETAAILFEWLEAEGLRQRGAA
jgi:pimeloyl-ACP methyl ester carboxylesterase